MAGPRYRRRAWSVLAGVIAMGLISGCAPGGFSGVYSLPLPGGADLGDHPYRVRIQFADVLDLVPQAGVKVDDVPVGRVERIDLADDGWTAEVTVVVNGDVVLPANATASLRQSSLLGEKFVQLDKPRAAPATDRLADNALIPVARSNRNTEVEEVFGALSLLLNGGGVAQVQNITRELNTAMDGNEDEIRALLSTMDTFVGELDSHRTEITRALDSLQRLSATLASQRDRIGGVLDGLAPGVAVLTRQREALVTMLRALDRLSVVATDTVNRTRDDLVANLRALAPILQELAAAGKDLPESLEILLTFPYTDAVLDAVKTSDYVNVFLDLQPAIQQPDPRAPVVPLPVADTDTLPSTPPSRTGGGR